MSDQARQDGDGPSRRMSGGAWAAVGTIGAALVAGVVTLVTAYLPAGLTGSAVPAGSPSRGGPAGEVASTPAPSTAGTPPAASPAPPVPRSLLLDELTGRWQGTVSAAGQEFTMTLDIPTSCAEGRPCGTITTDLVGCVGDLVLVRVRDGREFDLATVDFHEGSSASCELRTGGGDYFTLGRDVLVYAAGYDGSRSGTLRRQA